MKITKKRLRKLVEQAKGESVIHPAQNFYQTKAQLLQTALEALFQVQSYERKESFENDEDLDEIVADLNAYTDAVHAMIDMYRGNDDDDVSDSQAYSDVNTRSRRPRY